MKNLSLDKKTKILELFYNEYYSIAKQEYWFNANYNLSFHFDIIIVYLGCDNYFNNEFNNIRDTDHILLRNFILWLMPNINIFEYLNLQKHLFVLYSTENTTQIYDNDKHQYKEIKYRNYSISINIHKFFNYLVDKNCKKLRILNIE